MPLSMVEEGEPKTIVKVGEKRKFVNSLRTSALWTVQL